MIQNEQRRDATQGVDSALVGATTKDNGGNKETKCFHFTLVDFQWKDSRKILEKGATLYYDIEYDKASSSDGSDLEVQFRKHVYKPGIERFQYLPTQLEFLAGAIRFQDRSGKLTGVSFLGRNLRFVSTQMGLFDGNETCNWGFDGDNVLMVREYMGYYIFSAWDGNYDEWHDDDNVWHWDLWYAPVLAVKKEFYDGYLNSLNEISTSEILEEAEKYNDVNA